MAEIIENIFTPPIGHERRWDALVNAWRKDMVPQTLLLSGPRHVGKTLLVKHVAQLLMCPNVETSSTRSAPCGNCKTCHQIEIETFPDFKIYRPIVSSEKEARDRITAPEALEGSLINIYQAREFGLEAMRRPLVGQRKVMLICQAERMDEDAQNTLLKTFEEPIAGLTIILVCQNPDKILPTVRSRCWHLPLSATSSTRIAGWLRDEFPDADETRIENVARTSQGLAGAARRAMQRDAQSSREQQLADFVHLIQNASPVTALRLGEEASRLAKEWWDEDEAGDGLKSLKKGDAKFARSQVARFLDELSNVYRVKWAQAATQNATSSTRSDGADEAEPWARGLDQIRKTRHYILRNANTTLALDVLFMRLIRSAHGEVL